MKKILIADDSEQKSEFLEYCIENHEIKNEVSHAVCRTTEDAIQIILEDSSFVAGFIDYEMPLKNGPHVIREWRRIEKEQNRARSLLCLCTNAFGSRFEQYKKDALAAGADDAISLTYEGEISPVTKIMSILERVQHLLHLGELSQNSA